MGSIEFHGETREVGAFLQLESQKRTSNLYRAKESTSEKEKKNKRTKGKR